MARLVVLASPALADGFRLAGPATHTARPGPEAVRAVRSLAAESDVGLLLVTADLWASLDDRLRDTLERLPRPIVQAIPAGTVTDVTTRRQLLGEMLQRAIGYRVELAGTRPQESTAGGGRR
jgi:vacuolar-type H+-ATPase subunit F/Vma7